jgi:pyrimidine deaminase RibD-like protein
MSKSNNLSEKSHEERYMKLALALARRGYPGVFPNPPVGAVIVSNGKTISTGYHKKAGSSHAERAAIDECRFPEKLRGSTLYVTLEPCSHHGRTAPCTEAIIEAGISRVVYGVEDSNIIASGGATVLAENGVSAECSSLRDICGDFLLPWKRWIMEERKSLDVFVILSLNGLLSVAPATPASTSDMNMSFIRRMMKRKAAQRTQKHVKACCDTDGLQAYHFGVIPESPEELSWALESHLFNSFTVFRAPVFASEGEQWSFWSSTVSLKRKCVQKSGNFFEEVYGKE